MPESTRSQSAAIARFRSLHEAGCFLLPNPWDVGTTVLLEQLGFPAVATTSAGVAFARGLPDEVSALPLSVMLDHTREVVAATTLPVNADFQNGYADDPEGVRRNVGLCVATGVAGLSIEDNTGDPAVPLYERTLATARLRAARAAIDASGHAVVLTGRCEAWLVGDLAPFRTALDRLVAYAEAGADCLYAPGVTDPKEIASLVQAVAPKPLNVLVSRPVPGLSLARLGDLGVRRISLGSALARAAWGAFLRAARGLAQDGSFDGLADAASFAELNQAFAGRT